MTTPHINTTDTPLATRGIISDSEEKRFSFVDPSRRVLLVSHCLRPSSHCMAKTTGLGLECASCDPSCQVNRLKETALTLGYQGVCIAPGGSLALKYVKETSPLGIAAVACSKELEEGIDRVRTLACDSTGSVPPIVIIPLTREGCVDTQVDMDFALSVISLGCSATKL